MKKYHSLATILMSANLAMVCLTVAGLQAFHSVIVPIIAWAFYGAIICFWSLVITRSGLSPAKSNKTQGQTYKQILRYSLPLGIAGILTIATNIADPMVVGGLLNETRLGAYNLAITISGGLGAVLFAPLNTAFFPETSSDARDPKQLSNGLRLAFRYALLALVPISFAVAGLSKQFINLFSGGGSSYLVANLPLELMACFFLFIAMQGIPTSLLLSTGKTTQVMLIGVVTVVLDLALSLSLVPDFGLLGATTSRILVDIVGFLMALYMTKSYLVDVADVGFYAKVFVMSLIMLGLLSSLSIFVSNEIITLIPYGFVAGAILVLCVRGFGLLTEEDERYFEHFVPTKLHRLLRFLL
jgi:O-antigen/teichoic acid export membrane protein